LPTFREDRGCLAVAAKEYRLGLRHLVLKRWESGGLFYVEDKLK
jgi:hypothetical protein